MDSLSGSLLPDRNTVHLSCSFFESAAGSSQDRDFHFPFPYRFEYGSPPYLSALALSFFEGWGLLLSVDPLEPQPACLEKRALSIFAQIQMLPEFCAPLNTNR